MRRTLLLAIGIAVVGAFLLPTVASPFDASSDVDRAPPLEMVPSESPNGVYAQVGDDGNITLVIDEHNQEAAISEGGDGVNDEGVTHVDNVFTIAYADEEDTEWEVWLEIDGTDTQFYRGSDPTRSLEGPENSVRLGPTETLSVGLRIDTTGDDDVETIDEFTAYAEGVGEAGSESDSGEDDGGSGNDDGAGGDDSHGSGDGGDDDSGNSGDDRESGGGGGDGDRKNNGDRNDGDSGDGNDGDRRDNSDGNDGDRKDNSDGNDSDSGDGGSDERTDDDTPNGGDGSGNGADGGTGPADSLAGDDSAEEDNETTPAGEVGGGLEETLAGSLTDIWLLLLLLVFLGITATFVIRWMMRPE